MEFIALTASGGPDYKAARERDFVVDMETRTDVYAGPARCPDEFTRTSSLKV